jgi:hypothetical protein
VIHEWDSIQVILVRSTLPLGLLLSRVKEFRMNRRIFALVACAAAALTVAAADTKPDLSGEWKLNIDKSNFGPMPPPESETRTINHADPTLNMKLVRVGGIGDVTTDLNYTTDGKEAVNTIKTPNGDLEVKTTMTWEGKNLLEKSKLNLQGMDIAIEGRWELSEDGKTLTLNIKTSTPQGDFEGSQVYDKADAKSQ